MNLDNRKNLVCIGANDGKEIISLVNKYKNALFIEAIPNKIERLQENIFKTKDFDTNYIAINALVTSMPNQEYIFNIFDNRGASSSIYEPNTEKWPWPNIKIIEKINLISTTMENIFREYDWENIVYDVSLDVQGAELEVLKGFGEKNLGNIRQLVIEFSTEELYRGQVLFDELDSYLISKGFKSGSRLYSDNRKIHGDIIYRNICRS